MRFRHIVLAAAVLPLLTACGSDGGDTPRERVTAATPAAPANLCALVPDSARFGLEADATSDPSGAPTAACSLRSAPGKKPVVRVVITWTQLDGEDSANGVLDSQCRNVDTTEYDVVQDYTATGTAHACAATGRKVDETSIAAMAANAVLTVRFSSLPTGTSSALTRGTQLLESVVSELSTRS